MNVTRSTFYRVKKFRGQWPHEYSRSIKDVRANVISLSHNGGQLPSPRAHYAKKFINERNELNRWSPCYLCRRRDTDVMSRSARMGDVCVIFLRRSRARRCAAAAYHRLAWDMVRIRMWQDRFPYLTYPH